jgi:hypothetical protein
MASVLRAQEQNEEKATRKRKAVEIEVGSDSERPRVKRNKQRVLMLSSRGITHRMRHLMNDLEALLPHVKKGARGSCMFALLTAHHTVQTPSLIQKMIFICCLNSPISIIATMPCTSRHEGTKIYTSGLQKRQTDPPSKCTYRTYTQWTN